MEAIKVLIVEDDFMVAEINRSFTERVEGFRVVKVASTGKEALSFLEENPVDLVVLDVYLPDVHGIELLKALRKDEYPVDFILITAAHDSRAIEESMRFGIFDFIIKPFDAKRYEESLLGYKARRESLGSGVSLSQEAVDQALALQARQRPAAGTGKGINPRTMMKVEEAVSALGSGFGIDDISERLALSRITAHRYLECLVQAGRLEKEFEYKKVGRPTALYSIAKPRR
jgi:response regulator of citrate/malate metabolism